MLRPLAFLVVCVISAPLLANLQATAPTAGQSDSAAPRGSEQLQATVSAVEGLVQVRSAEDQPWQKATVGMTVGENAEFRTGPRSAVQFQIPPDQTITLDRLGTVKVLQAVLDNGKVKTALGMKYGRTRYDIEAAGREHEATISSPSSTLAVRGTKFSAYDQRPFPAVATSLTGRVEFRDFKKRVSFGRAGQGKTQVDTENPNAAAKALEQTVVDPSIALARSTAEATLVESLLSRGATVGFDYDKGIKVVRGGTVPQNDNELIPTLPGTLNFVMRWTGNTDLNLGVISPNPDPTNLNPGNLVVYPLGGFDFTKSGGVIPFDHRGGPNGGIEVAFWPNAEFPRGSYVIGAQYISGEITPATVDVFLNGQRVPIRQGPNEVPTAQFTGAPVDPSFGGAGIGVGTVRFQSISSKQVMTGPQPASPKRNKR